MPTSFTALPLHPALQQAIADQGYTAPTPIQEALIPLLLEGRDVVGRAQTGTGKTAAFALPLLHQLNVGAGVVQGLVLTPTRELALQVTRALHTYGAHLRARTVTVYGGQPYGPQIKQLRRGTDVVVGTPGRLIDLMERGVLDLGHVQTVVLDEADEMLSMGFVDDIETLLQATPSTRQTAFLSATLPKAIRQLCTRYQQDPVVCEMKHVQATADQIEHRHHLVHQHDKIAALTRLFEAEPIESALVFAHTRDRTDAVALALTERGYPAESLHGGMSQQARERVLRRFRDGQLSVLVGTDVAARGLDIDDITHVFNHDLPRDPEVYVHRVGRTGRAGRTGTAISLVAPHDKSRLRRIERFIKQSIPGRPLPTAEDLEARRTQALVDRVGVWLRRGRCTAERTLIDGLVAEGHDVAAVAAAALKVAREATEPKQPVAPVQPVEARPARGGGKRPPARRASAPGRPDRRDRNHRDRDHDMVTLKLNTGHAHGIHPKHIVRSLAENGGIPGRVIGRIDIQQHHTHVDVPASYVDRVLAQPKPYPMNARQVTVDRA